MFDKTEAFMGVDVGSISTKAVVMDAEKHILAKDYIWTEGNPLRAVKNLIESIQAQLSPDVEVKAVGTTGSARELIGAVLGASLIKNEITAHAVGTLSYHPDVRTIFEIGGQDSKIIIIEQGIVSDYAMNTLCAAGTGSFLSSQARRLNIPVEEFGDYALRSSSPTRIAGRCTVFAESDLVHKAQIGHPTQDIIAGLCNSIVLNYLNNVGKGKRIVPPIVFQGGVSKNVGVVKAFETITGYPIIVDDIGHLMGAIGMATLVQRHVKGIPFDFDIKDMNFRTVGFECASCANNCDIVCVLKDEQFLDAWGNRCATGLNKAKEKYRQPALEEITVSGD